MERIKIGGYYVHYKGKYYRVEGLARHSETLEEMVIYRQMYGDGALWVRPLEMFLEDVETNRGKMPRFRYLGQ